MRFRTFLATTAAALVGLVGIAAAPAGSAQSVTIAFTAGATVGHDIYLPGLGPDVSSTYTFDTAKPGLGGQKACVAVTSANGADAACQLKSTGAFGPIAAGLGANCAFSSGKGTVDIVRVNGTNVAPVDANGKGLVKVEWPAATGTILPLVFYRTNINSPVGQGAVQVTGASPGTCGIDAPTREFQVTGYSTAVI